ncbi:SIR2 family protein, partial [Photobacterium kishitanii]|uniref:SIR2 family protein n=1 Tax=Photobacterium kishitanii TaxID=318456 RepID=UPI000D4498C5
MKYEDLQKELSHKERSTNDLISYLETRTSNVTPNYNVLIGAGASVNSGIRTGQNLVDKWRKEIYELLSKEKYKSDEVAKNYLMTKEGNWYSESNEYSSLFEKKFDLPSQRRRFVENEVDNASPSIGYAYLASLVDSSDRYIDTIFTTNFDDLINEAFYQFSQTRPIVCAHDSSVRSLGLSSNRPKIIKLHGDYLFDDIKSTLRETESLESNIKNKFIEFSKEFGLIVVGYAGHDRSIMDVINHLLKSDEYFKNGIYWCIRREDYISSELRKLLWKDGVYFVLIDGFDELFAEIHHKTKGSLSIKDKLSESKQDKILSIFTEDRGNLPEKSSYISGDLE